MDRFGALLLHRDAGRAWDIGRLLARAGCHVTATPDETEALALLRSNPFRLVTIELGDRDPFGVGLLRWTRQHAAGTLRVVVSSRRICPNDDDEGVVRLDLRHDSLLLLEIARFCAAPCPDGSSPLTGTHLIDVLVSAVANPFGGQVLVLHDGEAGRIFAVEGRIAWCAAPRQGFLVDDLAAFGIPRPTLRRVLARCRQERTNFAETLIHDGLIDRDPMRTILCQRIRRCLWILRGWRDAQCLYLPSYRRFDSDLTFGLEEVLGPALPTGPQPAMPAAARSDEAAQPVVSP